MNAPFYKFGLFDDNASLILAFVIGLGFGFFLERGGFGSGNKLARQFYFRDLAVLKVMFTAIVTAMLGVFFLSRLGLMDLSQVYLTPTNLASNVTGGLILGVGFVIGGYCPGTSVVAAATGRIDAMVYLLGMFAGMVVVGFAMPSLEHFMHVGAMGPMTLATAWNVPYGVLVALVALMAAGAFFASEWAEVKTGAKDRSSQPLLGAVGWSASRKFVLTFVAAGVLAALVGNPYRGSSVRVNANELAQLVGREADHVSVDALASRLIEGKNELRVVDLRPATEFASYHIPSAENVPLTALATHDFEASEPVLLYSGADSHAAQAWVLLKSRGLRAYELAGGLPAWNDEILFPRLAAKNDPQLDAKRTAIARHFGGTPRTDGVDAAPAKAPELRAPTAPVAPSSSEPAAPVKKKKKEGC